LQFVLRSALSVVIFLSAVTRLAAGYPTTTTVNCSPNPAAVSQEVSCGANVHGPPGTSIPADGQVTFYDGTTVIDSMTLLEGGAAFTTSTLAQGVHPISAVYGGNATFSGSTSNTFYEFVGQPAPPATVTTLSASKNPAAPVEAVLFTIAVQSSGNPADGTVSLLDGSVVVAQAPLSNGMATASVSFASVGSHLMKADYSGSASYGASSASMTEIVQSPGLAATHVVVTSSSNPSVAGQSVIFRAIVFTDDSTVPTGMISWFEGATLLGSTPIDASGVSQIALALPAGTHALTAAYSGDALHVTGSGGLVQQVVGVASRGRAVRR
jgi:hypothetical protein